MQIKKVFHSEKTDKTFSPTNASVHHPDVSGSAQLAAFAPQEKTQLHEIMQSGSISMETQRTGRMNVLKTSRSLSRFWNVCSTASMSVVTITISDVDFIILSWVKGIWTVKTCLTCDIYCICRVRKLNFININRK